MKRASPALISFLANLGGEESAHVADVYTWVFADGTKMHLSGYQLQLQVGAAQFQAPDAHGSGKSVNYNINNAPVTFPLGAPIDRSKTTTKIGTDPDSIDLAIRAVAGQHTVGTLSWQYACQNLVFDGAFVEVNRLFMPTPGDTSLGPILWFYGRVGKVTIERASIKMNVESLMVVLKSMMPRRLFANPCTFIYGDAMCGVNRVAGTNALGQPSIAPITTAALAGSSAMAVKVNVTPNPQDSFANGTIVGVTGANTGSKRTIVDVNNNTAWLRAPLLYPVATGDRFTLLSGCLKGYEHCVERNNTARFGGFPRIPPPEVAL